MGLFEADLPDITIPNAGTVSPVVKAREQYSDAESIMLHSPSTLDAATFTIEVTDDPEVAAPVYETLEDDAGTDVTLPAVSRARRYSQELTGSKGFRLKSSVAVAADRIWKASKQWGA